MQSSERTLRPGTLYPHAQWYFLAAIVTTWVGFSQSYFARLGKVDIFHHIHGATVGLWTVLLVLEPILYQRGKMRLHRKLGRWGVYGLVPLIVACGAIMIHDELAKDAPYPPGAAYVLGALDVYALILFPLFVLLAIRYAREMQLHARFMACTVLVLLPPALGRAMFFVPWVHTFGQSLNLSYLLMVVALLVLMGDDWRKGRVRAPYPFALLLFVPLFVITNLSSGWSGWHRFADWYGAL